MARTNKAANERPTNGDEQQNSELGNEVQQSETHEPEVNLGDNGGSNTTDTGDQYGATEATTPKKRGRPAGSKNRTKAQETIFVQEQVAGGSQEKKKKQSAKFLSQEESTNLTKQILSITDFLAERYLGQQAKMMDEEKLLVEFGLPNILQSIELSTVEKASSMLYPLACFTGVTMYGIRVSGIMMENYRKNKKQKEQEQFNEEMNETFQQESVESNKYKASPNGEVDWSNKHNFAVRGY